MAVGLKKFDNGMKIVTDSFDNVETVAVGVWVNVGARHELPELTIVVFAFVVLVPQ